MLTVDTLCAAIRYHLEAVADVNAASRCRGEDRELILMGEPDSHLKAILDARGGELIIRVKDAAPIEQRPLDDMQAVDGAFGLPTREERRAIEEPLKEAAGKPHHAIVWTGEAL